jgi:hypothetical protein
MFKWNHLPMAGGLYDQHPKLLDDFVTISQVESKIESERQKKRDAENARRAKSSGGRRAGRRR